MPLQPLIQRLAAIQQQLTGKSPQGRSQATWRDLCVLPYALGAMQHAVLQLHQYQEQLFDEMSKVDLSSTGKYGPPHELSAPVAYTVDSFLDTARRTQNALIPFLSRGFRISLPSSLSDLVKGIERNKITIDSDVDKLLVHYWQAGGEQLKHYRDTCQHHALISAEAMVFQDVSGQLGLRLVLPSNPQNKTAQALLYGDPPIHAVPYVRSEFLRLISLTALLTSFLEKEMPRDLTPSIFVLAFEGLVIGSPVRNEGHKKLSMSALSEQVQQKLTQCAESFEGHAFVKRGDVS